MINNALGIASIVLAMVPLGISARRTARLKSLLEMHSTAMSFVGEPVARRIYNLYVQDLSLELMARTAIPGTLWITPIGFAGLLVAPALVVGGVLYATTQGLKAAADGVTTRQAFSFLLTEASLLGTALLTAAVLLAAHSVVYQYRTATARAIYLHALAPGSQACRRFVATAKAYAALMAVTLATVPIAALFGVDAVREFLSIGAGGLPWWTIGFPMFMGACFVWLELYMPLSPAFMRRDGAKANKRTFAYARLTTYASDTDDLMASAESFVRALEKPHRDLLLPDRDPHLPSPEQPGP